MTSEVLLLAGRSGVGKSQCRIRMPCRTQGSGCAALCDRRRHVGHGLSDTVEHVLAERNLAAMWANYRELGYRRLIFVNSACVLATEARKLAAAMGDDPRLVPIILTCTDATAAQRLGHRETGDSLDQHVDASRRMAAALTGGAETSTYRIATDDRTMAEIAADAIAFTGWPPEPSSSTSPPCSDNPTDPAAVTIARQIAAKVTGQ